VPPSNPVLPDTALTRWIAAGACFLLPGLGYVLLGEKIRGRMVGAGILAMFVFGLLIGGVAILDGEQPNAPFVRLGQRFLAPTLVANAVRLRVLEPARSPQEAAESPARMYTPAYGRMEEQGVLYTSIAGFLNLMTMIDIAGRSPRRRKVMAESNRGQVGTQVDRQAARQPDSKTDDLATEKRVIASQEASGATADEGASRDV